MTTNDIWAGKIVPKSLLVKQHQREKMAQEITLHKTLSHKYVVKLNSFFEDSNFVYIILELCRRRSLMELHKRRKAVTEPETRYFMNQILLGVKYLHNQKIIHRDLKLGNIFLNDEMEVNILKNFVKLTFRYNLNRAIWRIFLCEIDLVFDEFFKFHNFDKKKLSNFTWKIVKLIWVFLAFTNTIKRFDKFDKLFNFIDFLPSSN